MFHPSRGGTRGGKDQFSWEDVKQDKHRENYLGHSLMAPVGRWQKGKDLTWYAKKGSEDEKAQANASELSKIKEAEAEAMAIALGVRKKKTLESKVTEDELKQALNKDDAESEDEQMKGIDSSEKGLGYGRSSRFGMPTTTGGNMELMNAGDKSSMEQLYGTRRDSADTATNHDSKEDRHHKKKKKSKKHHKHKSEKKRHRHSEDSEDDYKKSSSRHRRRSPTPIKRERREEERYSQSRRYDRHSKEERHSRDERDRYREERHSRERDRRREERSRDRRSYSPRKRADRGRDAASPRDRKERSRSLERSMSPYSRRTRK